MARKAGSDVYRKWHDEVLRYQEGRAPKQGAVWLTLHPHVMVEWYPNVLVVSTLHPKGPRKTLNVVEFFYPEEIAAFEREFVDAEQAAPHWRAQALRATSADRRGDVDQVGKAGASAKEELETE